MMDRPPMPPRAERFQTDAAPRPDNRGEPRGEPRDQGRPDNRLRDTRPADGASPDGPPRPPEPRGPGGQRGGERSDRNDRGEHGDRRPGPPGDAFGGSGGPPPHGGPGGPGGGHGGPGGPAGPGGPGGQGAGGPPMEDVISVLKEMDPELADKIEKWRTTNPERVRGMLGQSMGKFLHMVDLRRTNPEMYKLRVQDFQLNKRSEDLGRQVRQAQESGKSEEAGKLTEQLKATIGEHFALRQKVRETELEQLERRIKEVREAIESRKKSKDDLIKARIDELTGKVQRPEF